MTMAMNEADWAITVVVVISTLISIKRGFIKEALSLLVWVAAFVVARTFSFHLAVLLENTIALEMARLAAAFAVLFVSSLIVGSLLAWLLGSLVKMSGLSGTDRLLGMVFGLARGGLVILVALIVIKSTPLRESAWWLDSSLIPRFLLLEDWSFQLFREVAGFISSLNGASTGAE